MMGRIISRQVVAIGCELQSCSEQRSFGPVVAPSTWHDEVAELLQLVDDGWALLLTSKLRAYCPEHASRVWDCSCRTHPDRARLCPAHCLEATALVWTDLCVPVEVEEFLQVMEVRS